MTSIPLNPPKDAYVELLSMLSPILLLLLVFGLPRLIFLGGEKDGRLKVFLRSVTSVLLVWGAVVAHRQFISLPATMEAASARGRLDYDGAAMNGVYFVLGWFPGVIGTAFAYLAVEAKRLKVVTVEKTL